MSKRKKPHNLYVAKKKIQFKTKKLLKVIK